MTDTAAVIAPYNAAFLERAPEKLVDVIGPDCVMEGTFCPLRASSARHELGPASARPGRSA
jgi:hypothetical protein